MKEFASVKHGFKLKFPGFPAVEDKNFAGVEDLTGMQIDGKRALEGGINGLVDVLIKACKAEHLI